MRFPRARSCRRRRRLAWRPKWTSLRTRSAATSPSPVSCPADSVPKRGPTSSSRSSPGSTGATERSSRCRPRSLSCARWSSSTEACCVDWPRRRLQPAAFPLRHARIRNGRARSHALHRLEPDPDGGRTVGDGLRRARDGCRRARRPRHGRCGRRHPRGSGLRGRIASPESTVISRSSTPRSRTRPRRS